MTVEWRSQGRPGGDFTLKVAETGVPPRSEAVGVAMSTTKRTVAVLSSLK
jgi:hypothetical protein